VLELVPVRSLLEVAELLFLQALVPAQMPVQELLELALLLPQALLALVLLLQPTQVLLVQSTPVLLELGLLEHSLKVGWSSHY
jgi:hypothetical protein|tara:strand:- start:324 stop:572 length:249 start_codon:yes stop_codon:yes gene_type:complete